MMRIKTYLSVFIVLALFLGPSVRPLLAAADEKMIRIAILQDVKEIEVSLRGQYEIQDPEKKSIVRTGRNFRKTKITVGKKGLRLGSEELKFSRLRFVSNKDVTVTVKGKERRYRGVVDVVRTKDNKLLAVNVIELEDYIRGVLYHEISHRWPMDAIIAQAVAARSYALYQMKVSTRKEFDVTNDVYSQVYGGRTSEKFRTNLAINRSAGEVLLYEGKLLPAYFHATCGGHTEDVRELWNHDLPPLKGVKCGFCGFSPHYAWKRNFQSSVVQKMLNDRGHKIGLIQEIKVSQRSGSGRVKKLTIIGRDGKEMQISGKEFREIIGPNHLRSTKYDIKMKGYFFDVIGYGWGHGVGLCQWGAYGMSLKRHDYKEILNLYYPGTEIADYRKLGTDPIFSNKK